MKENMAILIKKEIFEFFFNMKSWINVLGWALVTYLPKIQDPYHKFLASILFAIFAGGQYVFDSYFNDIKHGGALFLHNLHIPNKDILAIKSLIALILTTVALIINIPHLIPYMTYTDIFWILPLTITFTRIMYISSVFAKCTEITSAILAIIIVVAIFALIVIMPHFILKIVVAIIFRYLLSFLAVKLSNSKKYRTQL